MVSLNDAEIARLARDSLFGSAPHPFVPVDCSQLNDNLAPSTLFGRKKGAYTGADKDVDGLFARANNGVLLLDEVANLSEESQGLLLRVLQTGEFIPIGGNTPRKVNVVVIAMSSEALGTAAQQGRFRADLYNRLEYSCRIVVPPLNDRRADIPHLTEYLAEVVSGEYESGPFDVHGVLGALVAHDWEKKNVRTLLSVVRKAINTALDRKSQTLLPTDLEQGLLKDGQTPGPDFKPAPEELACDLVRFLLRRGGETKALQAAVERGEGRSCLPGVGTWSQFRRRYNDAWWRRHPGSRKPGAQSPLQTHLRLAAKLSPQDCLRLADRPWADVVAALSRASSGRSARQLYLE